MFLSLYLHSTAGVCEAVQASGPVDPAGRVQVAEETLSQSAPDLQRLLQTARYHRYCLAPGSYLCCGCNGFCRTTVWPALLQPSSPVSCCEMVTGWSLLFISYFLYTYCFPKLLTMKCLWYQAEIFASPWVVLEEFLLVTLVHHQQLFFF